MTHHTQHTTHGAIFLSARQATKRERRACIARFLVSSALLGKYHPGDLLPATLCNSDVVLVRGIPALFHGGGDRRVSDSVLCALLGLTPADSANTPSLRVRAPNHLPYVIPPPLPPAANTEGVIVQVLR